MGSRLKKRENIVSALASKTDEDTILTYSYKNLYDVWRESIYGNHLPHLVQYDDRNAMAYSVEGRSPFLDHRVAECVAEIRPEFYLKNGLRKFILREAFKDYLPDLVYSRTDKIGFYTPLVDAVTQDREWVLENYKDVQLIKAAEKERLMNVLSQLQLNNVNQPGQLTGADAISIFRQLSVHLWTKNFNVAI